jgi:GH25 family lysozyme M1 (1,4-beta-N-acetylmuramidase)
MDRGSSTPGRVLGGGMLFGIDVAEVDGNKTANWQLAKAQGPINFGIVRASQCTRTDKTFAKFWPQLQSAGLVRGAYMFLDYPRKGTKVAAPDVQAQKLVDTVGELTRTDLPPTLDIEFPGGRKVTGMTAKVALDWARTAWTTLRDAYGTPPIIYTSARVWIEDLANQSAPDLVESPLWLARYFWKSRTPAMRDAAAFANGKNAPPVPMPWGNAWAVHQYQGDALKLPGFSSTIDMNRFNTMTAGTKGDFVKWAQRRLGLVANGTFDTAMAKAVSKFQRKRQLVADAVIGPRTFAALCWR